MTAPGLRTTYRSRRRYGCHAPGNDVDSHAFSLIAGTGNGTWERTKSGNPIRYVEGTEPRLYRCGLCSLIIPGYRLVEGLGYDRRCPEVLAALPPGGRTDDDYRALIEELGPRVRAGFAAIRTARAEAGVADGQPLLGLFEEETNR